MAIKRHVSLQEFSKDHHQALLLLLCWKIKVGLAKNIPVERIEKYTNWFYKNHILEHFELEEKYMFTVLNKDDKLIIRVLEEHKFLLNLFAEKLKTVNSLEVLHIKLKEHIRFEEQILFNEIQNKANQQQLDLIEKHHKIEKFKDNLEDVFWR